MTFFFFIFYLHLIRRIDIMYSFASKRVGQSLVRTRNPSRLASLTNVNMARYFSEVAKEDKPSNASHNAAYMRFVKKEMAQQAPTEEMRDNHADILKETAMKKNKYVSCYVCFILHRATTFWFSN